MYQTYLRISNVSYTYPGSNQQAVSGVSLNLDSGWTAFAGANGCGKTTLLKLATGLLTPDTGSIVSSGTTVYCSQRTDHLSEFLDEFLFDWSSGSIRLRDILNIGDDWGERWDTLSYGERRRLQIAAAIWTSPSVLALDEPFNHLDTDGRSLLIRAMREYHGCGLLVSHDRNALDLLCTSCVLFFPERIQLYRTGYTSAMKAERKKQEYLTGKRKMAGVKYLQLKRDARKKMIQARTLQAHLSGKRISFKDICKYNYDGPSQYTSRVQNAGRRSREASARAERAKDRMESIKYRKIYGTGVELTGEISTRNYLLEILPGEIRIGEATLTYPHLEIKSEDRIALTGGNGTGKTMLLAHLRSELNCPPEKLIWIPQEITAGQCSCLLEEIKKRSREDLGQIMTIVRRLGSDPERVLCSEIPSPGEARKLLLAFGLSKTPWLVIMDEPTNHMDLPSVECLEKALNDYTGALVLVSHDREFLGNTTSIQWNIMDRKLSVTKNA
ncbi:MAG: ABC-F family ATP-binding cassette domain-containing protein [Candidatus Aegiribacteria sp.]|nr:ABC-F family ATP-binding cassette domain-containing protein [Candidatus Aegiribacteria sp.]